MRPPRLREQIALTREQEFLARKVDLAALRAERERIKQIERDMRQRNRQTKSVKDRR